MAGNAKGLEVLWRIVSAVVAFEDVICFPPVAVGALGPAFCAPRKHGRLDAEPAFREIRPFASPVSAALTLAPGVPCLLFPLVNVAVLPLAGSALRDRIDAAAGADALVPFEYPASGVLPIIEQAKLLNAFGAAPIDSSFWNFGSAPAAEVAAVRSFLTFVPAKAFTLGFKRDHGSRKKHATRRPS